MEKLKSRRGSSSALEQEGESGILQNHLEDMGIGVINCIISDFREMEFRTESYKQRATILWGYF
jgi:hypothetical protein